MRQNPAPRPRSLELASLRALGTVVINPTPARPVTPAEDQPEPSAPAAEG